MKAKFKIDNDIEIKINSNEYDDIMEFIYDVRQVLNQLCDEIQVCDEQYKYDYGALDEN